MAFAGNAMASPRSMIISAPTIENTGKTAVTRVPTGVHAVVSAIDWR